MKESLKRLKMDLDFCSGEESLWGVSLWGSLLSKLGVVGRCEGGSTADGL